MAQTLLLRSWADFRDAGSSVSADRRCVRRASNSRATSGTRRQWVPSPHSVSLGSLFQVFRRLVDRIETSPPDAAILIDFPDFNLRLAKRIKAANIPIIYYISPQVWAWREGRVKQIRALVTKMLVIFPFEEKIYRDAGVDVEFVGHPLIETVRATRTKEEFCRAHGIDPEPADAGDPSRQQEKGDPAHPADAVRSRDRIRASKPETQFVLPAAPNLDRSLIDEIVGNRRIKIIQGDTYNALRYARAAIVASGTATLEAALLGTPEVIVYRISAGGGVVPGKILFEGSTVRDREHHPGRGSRAGTISGSIHYRSS